MKRIFIGIKILLLCSCLMVPVSIAASIFDNFKSKVSAEVDTISRLPAQIKKVQELLAALESKEKDVKALIASVEAKFKAFEKKAKAIFSSLESTVGSAAKSVEEGVEGAAKNAFGKIFNK